MATTLPLAHSISFHGFVTGHQEFGRPAGDPAHLTRDNTLRCRVQHWLAVVASTESRTYDSPEAALAALEAILTDWLLPDTNHGANPAPSSWSHPLPPLGQYSGIPGPATTHLSTSESVLLNLVAADGDLFLVKADEKSILGPINAGPALKSFDQHSWFVRLEGAKGRADVLRQREARSGRRIIFQHG